MSRKYPESTRGEVLWTIVHHRESLENLTNPIRLTNVRISEINIPENSEINLIVTWL